jgi:hypothetical protein
MKNGIIRFGALIVFAIVMFGTFFQASERDGLGWWGESFPIASLIGTSLLLLVGIMFGTLFRTISAKEGKRVDIVAEIRDVFTDNSFWISICVSPFVFFAVYAVIRASPSDPASYLLAFQNGFFCESVFKRLTSGEGTRTDETVDTPASVTIKRSAKRAGK